MSNPVVTAEGLQRVRDKLMSRLPLVLRVSGLVLLIAGLQTGLFYRHYVPELHRANANLDQLLDEVPTNTRLNKVLNELADFRRVSEDEGQQKEVLTTYERFIKSFLESRLTALEEFHVATSGFSAPDGTLAFEALRSFREGFESVRNLYADHYAPLIEDIDSPPLYMQPTAAFLKRDGLIKQYAVFNRALYLSVVGDRSSANALFNELKDAGGSPEFISVVHYAQGRMLYDTFHAEGQFEYYQQAIQNIKQSLRENPDYGIPKLFLEYLLSFQSGSSTVNAPVTGDGTGEAEGERGVISSELPNF